MDLTELEIRTKSNLIWLGNSSQQKCVCKDKPTPTRVSA